MPLNAGVAVAIAGVVVTVLIAVFGGIIKHLLDRVAKYEARLEAADRTLDAKQETVEELRRQVSRLEITAELQDKFFGQLPRLGPAQPMRRDGP